MTFGFPYEKIDGTYPDRKYHCICGDILWKYKAIKTKPRSMIAQGLRGISMQRYGVSVKVEF